jgi:hypothetical protein
MPGNGGLRFANPPYARRILRAVPGIPRLALLNLTRAKLLGFLAPELKLLLTRHISGLSGNLFCTLSFPLNTFGFRTRHS